MAVPHVDGIENKLEIPNDIVKAMDAESGSQLDTGDSEYVNKCRVVNGAIQDIGMGKYQWRLFIVTGFGYFSDNAWMVAINLILPTITPELTSSSRLPYLTLGQNIGLLLGAAFWGIAADIWGRNLILFLWCILPGLPNAHRNGGGMDSFFLWSFDELTSLEEFLPGTHQYLLTVLSIWWAFGRGRDLEAIAVVKKVGEVNGKEVQLSVDALTRSGSYIEKVKIRQPHENMDYMAKEGDAPIIPTKRMPTAKSRTSSAILNAKSPILGLNHIKPLFATKKLMYSTSLLIVLWGLIGLAFPLYSSFITYYLATRGAHFGDGSTYVTYRNVSHK
uniref:Uncharacterized protein n=1 Tax=Psilocybe cubensis TaxID=181762 RepID=A0A8H8CG40_PSICU